MAVGERFSFGKFFGSFFQSLSYVKAIALLLRIGLIAAVVGGLGWAVYRTYIKPPETQKQNTRIVVQQGGTLNLQQTQKQEVKKRAWWVPSIFGEVYGFKEIDDNEGRTGIGGRAGLRWEW